MDNKNIVIIVLIILALGAGGYYFYAKNSNPELINATDAIIPMATPAADKNSDSDKDGLPDAIESLIGSDSYKTDTDGDSYSDLSEIKNGYSPIVAGSTKILTEEWQVFKDKIKAADNEFYEKIFATEKEPKINNPDKPSDLKTYRNEEYGFELKYPNDWETIKNTPGIMSFARTIDIKTKKPDKVHMIQIRIAGRKEGISFVEQIKGKSGSNPELRKMNGKDFYYAKNSLAGVTFYEYNLEHKNKVFTVFMLVLSELPENVENESDIVYPTDDELREELSVLDKMVSTFEFIQ